MKDAEFRDRESLLRAIFESTPDIITVSTLEDGTFLEVNPAFVQLAGYTREEVLGKSSLSLGIWADPGERERFAGLLRNGEPVRGFEARLRSKSGEERRYQLSASPLEAGGKPALVMICRDITAAAEAAARERKSAFLLERAEEMAKIGSWEFDYATKTVTGSEGAARIYGVPRENLTVGDIETIPLPEYRPLLNKARDDHILRGLPYDVEFKICRRSDGRILDLRSRALWDGAKKRLFGIIRDVTDEKRAEEGLRKAITERDLLIQELFHRINNTLQVVLSLLMLEAERDEDRRVDDLVSRMRRRVAAIASVHRSLYTARDVSRISLLDFLSRFLETSSRIPGGPAAELSLDADGVDLNIEAAVPCGILLAELVDNAMVHGRVPGRPGRVSVTARRLGDGRVELRVADDGPGLEVNLRDIPRSWLGLRLVKMLAEGQLGGTFQIRNSPGLECVVVFDDDRLGGPA